MSTPEPRHQGKVSDQLQASASLYELHGKPLESDHWGEYVAVTPDGRTLLGYSLSDITWKARKAFGSGVHIFKIGSRTVGRL